MRVGLIGLGRMGEGMSRRMLRSDIEVIGYRRDYEKAVAARDSGYITDAARDLNELVQKVRVDGEPAVFLMVVPAENVSDTIADLVQAGVTKGDVIVDHGNSNFRDSRKRAQNMEYLGIDYVDCGTSGGVYGLERGYCLMIGGETHAVAKAAPVFRALAPGIGAAPRTDSHADVRSVEHGWLHCGGPGAGHFTKMVHNGVEYGLMQAYAEGFNLLSQANAGADYVSEGDAEVAPMDNPEDYCYDIDVGEVAELWRRGSVVGSWLLDLTAEKMQGDNSLSEFEAGVSDSGEGRWTAKAAVDLGVPAPVITTALFARFESRQLGAYANRVLNAMRAAFGGHATR